MSAPDWLVARPIAHRGLHDRAGGILENTLSAAEAAIARGFAIECDVQDTSDGDAVVFHDHTLDRREVASKLGERRKPRAETGAFVRCDLRLAVARHLVGGWHPVG